MLSKLKEAGKLSSDVGIRLLQPLGLVVEEVSTCVERMALATNCMAYELTKKSDSAVSHSIVSFIGSRYFII
jgi:hypothetical protein